MSRGSSLAPSRPATCRVHPAARKMGLRSEMGLPVMMLPPTAAMFRT